MIGDPHTSQSVSAADVHSVFRGLIASGRLGSGERLPTVRQAAADFAVAPGTIQRAYKMLEGDGLIVSRVGSGTRVAESAGIVSADLARRLRELATAARHEAVPVETLVDALRVMWRDSG